MALGAHTCDHLSCATAILQEIAAAKAGILKEGRPAIVARQPEPEALATLEEHAQSAACTILRPQQTLQRQVHIHTPSTVSPSSTI